MENGPTINFMGLDNSFLKMGHIIREVLDRELQRVRGDIYLTMDAFMRDKLVIMRRMERGVISIPFKVMNLQGSGHKMSQTAEENKNSEMVHTMRVNLAKE